MSSIGAAFTDRLLPVIETFKPDLILISAGFDSRIDDPLGQFRLTDEDFVAQHSGPRQRRNASRANVGRINKPKFRRH